MKEILNRLNKPGYYLLLANVFLVFFLILLSNTGVLPFKKTGDFAFFVALTLAFALYRPGWAFLFFVGTIALENINLAPKEIGIMIRPYQFLGGLTALALLIKLSTKRLGFNIPKFSWPDAALAIFAIAGFVSAFGAIDKSVAFKQSVVAASFVALYLLARIFIQNSEDTKKIIPFFLSSSIIIVLYGVWQNIRFTHGLMHFETMPGRPNATFTEPDWLGIYVTFIISAVYSLLYYFSKNESLSGDAQISNFQPACRTDRFPIFKQFLISKYQIFKIFLYSLLTACYVLLILTVSRSAWLGSFATTFTFLFIILTDLKLNFKFWRWKIFLEQLTILAIVIILSLGIVYIFHLTNFQLLNRAQSTVLGLQKITVSCEEDRKLPERIEKSEELEEFGCRHINLEEIEAEKSAGNFVSEIYRDDPNVNIRSEIYQKSWREIKKHPILGIGWGNISPVLGKDERGAGLNSSNIFLEVWLGSGLVGITSFVLVWIYIIINAGRNFLKNDPGGKAFGLFLFLGFFALLIPNLFNAGVFLGILWLFFAIATGKK